MHNQSQSEQWLREAGIKLSVQRRGRVDVEASAAIARLVYAAEQWLRAAEAVEGCVGEGRVTEAAHSLLAAVEAELVDATLDWLGVRA